MINTGYYVSQASLRETPAGRTAGENSDALKILTTMLKLIFFI